MNKRFARINSLSKKVDTVIVATDEFINSLPDYDLWVASSVTDTKKLADKNDIYDVDNNNFKAFKPYDSWVFNDSTWNWKHLLPCQIKQVKKFTFGMKKLQHGI